MGNKIQLFLCLIKLNDHNLKELKQNKLFVNNVEVNIIKFMNNSKNEIYQKGYTKGKEKILNDIELNNLNKIWLILKQKKLRIQF